MGRAYLFVEGQGDEQAALNLVIRLWQDLALNQLSPLWRESGDS
jgi:hypothetical protein